MVRSYFPSLPPDVTPKPQPKLAPPPHPITLARSSPQINLKSSLKPKTRLHLRKITRKTNPRRRVKPLKPIKKTK